MLHRFQVLEVRGRWEVGGLIDASVQGKDRLDCYDRNSHSSR